MIFFFYDFFQVWQCNKCVSSVNPGYTVWSFRVLHKNERSLISQSLCKDIDCIKLLIIHCHSWLTIFIPFRHNSITSVLAVSSQVILFGNFGSSTKMRGVWCLNLYARWYAIDCILLLIIHRHSWLTIFIPFRHDSMAESQQSEEQPAISVSLLNGIQQGLVIKLEAWLIFFVCWEIN